MKIWFLSILFLVVAVAAFAGDDLTANPGSLAFGNVNQGQAKSLTFGLKNITGHKVRAELTAEAPFTVSPASPTLDEGQQINITVSLPASVAPGSLSKKVNIKGSRLGLFPRDQGTVALAATVVVLPDVSIKAEFNGDEVNGSNRVIGLHLTCKNSTGTTTNNTKVFVSKDGGPEVKDMDITFVYTAAGQINGYGIQNQPTTIQSYKFRAVAAPPTNDSNPANNESIVKLNCTTTDCTVVP
jgi:hypothetical protein